MAPSVPGGHDLACDTVATTGRATRADRRKICCDFADLGTVRERSRWLKAPTLSVFRPPQAEGIVDADHKFQGHVHR